MLTNYNIEKVEVVADGLEEMISDIVFVGGAIASLYADDPAALYVRPTIDVDCIIQLDSRGEFSRFEEALRKKGFCNDISEGAPICRWTYKGILVDVMPTELSILGFTSIWYREGISHRTHVTLPNGKEIAILDLPYFIATKIEAFHGRDESDFRISHDIEDIIVVLDGRLNFNKLYAAPLTVKKYLIEEFRQFLESSLFIESVSAHIDHGNSPQRAKRIIDFLKDFVLGCDGKISEVCYD